MSIDTSSLVQRSEDQAFLGAAFRPLIQPPVSAGEPEATGDRCGSGQVSHSICVPHSMCPTLCDPLYVPLMCLTPCVSHSMCASLCVPHSVCLTLCASLCVPHSVCLTPCASLCVPRSAINKIAVITALRDVARGHTSKHPQSTSHSSKS